MSIRAREAYEVTRRLRRCAVCAPTLVALLSGCDGGPVTVALPSSRQPPCVERDAALVGWLDGDARPDRVVLADNGDDTTVEWGTTGGGFGRPVGFRALAGSRKGETAAGVAADSNRDDELDLAVVVSKPPERDDPVPARIAETRLGPLHRNGRSGRTLGLNIDETSGLPLTDFHHDGLPKWPPASTRATDCTASPHCSARGAGWPGRAGNDGACKRRPP